MLLFAFVMLRESILQFKKLWLQKNLAMMAMQMFGHCIEEPKLKKSELVSIKLNDGSIMVSN